MGQVVQLFNQQHPKLRAFRTALEKGIVAITLDARKSGVQVPSNYIQNPFLVLNFSYQYYLPDFAFDEQGVSATLDFDEGYFFCVIPWNTVYRIGDNIWPEDVPK